MSTEASQTFCGNYVVEDGEECDAGQEDQCCDASCNLKEGAVCRSVVTHTTFCLLFPTALCIFFTLCVYVYLFKVLLRILFDVMLSRCRDHKQHAAEWIKQLSSRSNALGCDSHCWPCVNESSILLIPCCFCSSSSNGYLVEQIMLNCSDWL